MSIEKALEHFKRGISHDIFKEPVTTYAEQAIKALEFQKQIDNSETNYIIDTARTFFEEWNNVTGAVPKGTSWYYELESVIEDIVKLSFGAGVLYKSQINSQ